MTYYGGKELGASFRTVRSNTIKIAEKNHLWDLQPQGFEHFN